MDLHRVTGSQPVAVSRDVTLRVPSTLAARGGAGGCGTGGGDGDTGFFPQPARTRARDRAGSESSCHGCASFRDLGPFGLRQSLQGTREAGGNLLMSTRRRLPYTAGSTSWTWSIPLASGRMVREDALLVGGPAGDARVSCLSTPPARTVHHRHHPGNRHRRAEGRGARRYGDNPECRDERSPKGGQREEWILSVPQPSGGRVRADHREGPASRNTCVPGSPSRSIRTPWWTSSSSSGPD